MLKKKSLGQHFLHAPAYLEKIVEAAGVKEDDLVLEIGPGDGALTEVLLTKGARVIAVEKDHRLIPILKNKYSDISPYSFHIIEEDVLRVDISNHLPKDEAYKIVANIPYYITGAVIKKFLSSTRQPTSMTLLVQKEVAERIAREPKESILSLSVKAYGEPTYVKTVPRGAFTPPPNVDSAILHIGAISRERFRNYEQEERFFELIRAGFAHKRKLLARNLEPVLGTESSNILKNVGISPMARAEDLALKDWLHLV